MRSEGISPVMKKVTNPVDFPEGHIAEEGFNLLVSFDTDTVLLHLDDGIFIIELNTSLLVA